MESDRITMDPDTPTQELGHDIPGTKKIRYVITLIQPTQELPDDPLAQKLYLEGLREKIETHLKPERFGITAVVES